MTKEQEITLLYQLIEKHFGSGALMQFEDLTETDNDQLLNRIETMTTYNTYQEAKIANPDQDIYNDTHGKFRPIKDAPTSHFANGWELCKPQNYCMTVERFLVGGHRLEIDDWVIGVRGLTFQISSNEIDEWNVKSVTPMDSKLYILRAAALETKEPKRTKESYEKVEFIKLSDAALAVDAGNIQFNKFGNQPIDDKALALHYYNNGTLSFYRRIETPIEWWEDANDLLGDLANLSLDDDGVLQLTMEKGQVGFGMSRDKWCDFARILLEQGE